ncbi:hypothetical protein ZWY2020_051448 [Hordeum vulgare]|nr:hypothetical protein ZWY2020_051448 [Hordeum vulgare]
MLGAEADEEPVAGGADGACAADVGEVLEILRDAVEGDEDALRRRTRDDPRQAMIVLAHGGPRCSSIQCTERLIRPGVRPGRHPAGLLAFPYYFLVALKADGYLGTFAGLRVRAVEAVARGILPRHYAAGVRTDSWEVFRGCGAGRRVVVTASPTVMVGPFVREFVGAEVAGMELGTCCGHFTGLISGGMLVAGRKREVVERLFAGGRARVRSSRTPGERRGA